MRDKSFRTGAHRRVAVVALTAVMIIGGTGASSATADSAERRGEPVGDAADKDGMESFAAPAAASGSLTASALGAQSPQVLADALVGSGVTISNVTYTGAENSSGFFAGGGEAIGVADGIVLSSGAVETTGDNPCNKGVEGPNECTGNTSDNGLPGDEELTELSGVPTNDATVLEFDFVPNFSGITFRYVFASDEYREYANTQYNDTFAFLVNGANCALVPGTGEPVGVNTINNGNPGGDATAHNNHLYVDNPADAPARDTEMDGLTVVLSCDAAVTPGVSNHMKLAIADGSDSILDSNVFIEAGSFESVPQEGDCVEDGLASISGSGIVSGIVHQNLEQPLTQLSEDLGVDDLGAEVHTINCETVVPLEGDIDELIAETQNALDGLAG